MLKVNDVAPNLEMKADDGATYKMEDFKGKKVILYFYPKDSTPGCTSQACSLNESLESIEAKDAVVIGVSKDSIKSHLKFREKYGLQFLLISDEDLKLAEAYGVWQEKMNYGKTYMGVVRTTFLIDENGVITHVLDKVKVKTHGEDILELI